MASRAEASFSQIVKSADPAAYVTDLANKRTQEAEFLEFKGGKIDENALRQYWSQAISGFANTEGGVLIFGIDARPEAVTVDGKQMKVDRAVGIAPVPGAEGFAQRLRDAVLHATQDPIQGIECCPFVSDATSGAGFVVCLIPEGNNKPYRAKLEKNEPYFMRVGTSFVVIPHSLLRSLFFPQIRANLRCDITTYCRGNLNQRNVMFRISLHNDGPASARDLVAKVFVNRNNVDSRANDRWDLMNQERLFGIESAWGTRMNRTLHPQDSDLGFEFVWQTGEAMSEQEGLFRIVRFVRLDKALGIWLALYMDDQPPAYLMHTFAQPINSNETFAMDAVDFNTWQDHLRSAGHPL